MKLLFGTTNPGKIQRLRAICGDLPIDILAPNDLELEVPSIVENGTTPGENSLLKAKAFYAVSSIPTFSMDFGLYIHRLPAKEQPGLQVRRINGRRATDQEMLDYYTLKLQSVGGESPGEWVAAIALVWGTDKQAVHSFSDPTLLTARQSPIRIPGEPLASIQIDPTYGKYKSEITATERQRLANNSDQEIYRFLQQQLSIVAS